MHIGFVECKFDIERFATTPVCTTFVIGTVEGEIHPAAVDSLICDL